jgi:uncharacterized protein YgbK (DUF1537 family)
MFLNYNDTINSFPVYKEEQLSSVINEQLQKLGKTIIVLDDDPTGTQTMHGVPILTVWDVHTIIQEIKRRTPLFYILTNSRSLPKTEADALHRLISKNIRTAFEQNKKEFILISRGDSTLRGHYPNDVYSIAEGLNCTQFVTAIIPAFFEGGRYTINDTHYLKEGHALVPVASTPFANDNAFGFSNSDLKKWIEEKTEGTVKAVDVISFSIEELRINSADKIANKIKKLPSSAKCIVNAAAYCDLQKFASAYLNSGVTFIFRTASSFVKAISGKEDKSLLQKEDLINNRKHGGLIVVGSYVSKTTQQLNHLLSKNYITAYEIAIDHVLQGVIKPEDISTLIEKRIIEGESIVLYTSRKLHYVEDKEKSLVIGNQIADFITKVVSQIQVIPKFMIVKGGITSSDIAAKALQVKRAIVIGQALPGIPVWKLENESKFPGMNYIIFPGNVGDDDTLTHLFKKLSTEKEESC